MELVVEPDIYAPSIDDKIYETHSIFVAHTKTKTHQKWLEMLNTNKANFYVDLEKAKEVISNQRLIIAKLEKDVSNKIMTIDYLTQQLHNTSATATSSTSFIIDLLDFD